MYGAHKTVAAEQYVTNCVQMIGAMMPIHQHYTKYKKAQNSNNNYSSYSNSHEISRSWLLLLLQVTMPETLSVGPRAAPRTRPSRALFRR